MRVINVIETNTDNGVIGIESFAVYEEQLSDEVVKQAEACFAAKAIENGADADDIDVDIEYGYYATKDGYTVSFAWSYVYFLSSYY